MPRNYASTDQPNMHRLNPLDCVACHRRPRRPARRGIRPIRCRSADRRPSKRRLPGLPSLRLCGDSGRDGYSCHDAITATGPNPNHQASGSAPIYSMSYHSRLAPAHYDHNPRRFRSRGAPAGQLRCMSCPSIRRTPSDCYACHQSNYDRPPSRTTAGGVRSQLHQCHTPPPGSRRCSITALPDSR